MTALFYSRDALTVLAHSRLVIFIFSFSVVLPTTLCSQKKYIPVLPLSGQFLSFYGFLPIEGGPLPGKSMSNGVRIAPAPL
jgi:hypothetical protein